MISRTEIQDASRRIAMHVRRTPVMALEERAFGLDARIFFKLECLQHTGSFKPRGAFNCILTSTIADAGVIAASGGNHGAAVAFAAQKLGHRAEIFVPVITPPNKVDRLRQYGATINVTGNNYAEALAASQERALQTGAVRFTRMTMSAFLPARALWVWNWKSRCAVWILCSSPSAEAD